MTPLKFVSGSDYITGGTLIRLRMKSVPVENKRKVVDSHSQEDLVKVCSRDFLVKCEISTNGSTRRSRVVEHLCNFSDN